MVRAAESQRGEAMAPRFQVIDAFSRVVRLGEGVALTGRLAPAAMERTLAALRVCAAKIRLYQPMAQRVVATEACRRAANATEFLALIEAETGLAVELISAEEEARLALAGCAALLTRSRPRALVFDIGGGSTEILWLDVPEDGPPRVRGWISLALGVVSLADAFRGLQGGATAYEAMRAAVADALAPFERAHGIAREVADGAVQMLGTSGTVTTLAGIHLDLARYDRARVDGLTLSHAELAEASRRIVAMTDYERAENGCIGRARADLVVAGCAIYDEIATLWPADEVRIADRGVREGILLGLMGVPAPRDGQPA